MYLSEAVEIQQFCILCTKQMKIKQSSQTTSWWAKCFCSCALTSSFPYGQ